MRRGMDISSYNGTVDFDLCKRNGIDFSINKIIRRDLNRDNQFNRNHAECNRVGIDWGVYNYSYATTPAKAISDMTLVCDILDSVDKSCFRYGVWFDIEDAVQAVLSKATIASIINAAQKTVEDRGYSFGVYTGMSYYNEHIDRSKVACDNWWIARYYNGYERMNVSQNPDADYKPKNAGDIVAWQYTSSGYIGAGAGTGNSNRFDLNILYKEIESSEKKESKMEYSREKVVDIMRSWVGKKESDNSFRSIIDEYNTINPLPQNYKLSYGDEWCAGTVSAAYHKAGYDNIFPFECSCKRMIDKAVKMGVWVENDAYIPHPGDCILYDWQDSGAGDNKGWPDHVGMVESVSGNNITVIEGNYNEKVARRNITVNSRYIRGYVTPNFTADDEASYTTDNWLIMGNATAKRDMHIRLDASTDSDILGTVTEGTTLKVIGFKNGWFRVLYRNKVGYTYNGDGLGYIYKRKYFENSKYWAKVVDCTALNLRIGPGRGYKNVTVLPTIPVGTAVQVTDGRVNSDSGKPWYVVSVKGIYGFVCGDYLKR